MNPPGLRATVVIPHHRDPAMLSACLDAVSPDLPDSVEVVVVDNASAGDLEAVRARHPQVRFVRSERNLGFAGGANLGARHAGGGILVFLNDDTEPVAGWLDLLLARLDDDPQIAAVQPKLVQARDPRRFDYAGACGGYLDTLGFPYARGRIFQNLERDRGQYDGPARVFWASGAAFAIRRADFEAAGGFDGSFFAHMEEVDLCWRLALLGREVWAEPAAVVHHHGGGTLAPHAYLKHYLNHRNSLLMLFANSPGASLLPRLLVRELLEIAALGYALALRDPRHAAAIVAAHAWVLTHPHTLIAKRRRAAPFRRAGRASGLAPRSVAYHAFLRGRHTFAEVLEAARGRAGPAVARGSVEDASHRDAAG